MNAWRPDRDEEGWKVGTEMIDYDSLSPPMRVAMVKRMRFDVEALETLTLANTPPERLLRLDKRGAIPQYVFADASGAGFGVSSWTPGSEHVEVAYGAWNPHKMKNLSSNQRELANIVYKIEMLDAEGNYIPARRFLFLPTTSMPSRPSTEARLNQRKYSSLCSNSTRYL
ncbi:hypothetical protein ACA910_017990 [Epithemia clementina (nom. ined.)]